MIVLTFRDLSGWGRELGDSVEGDTQYTVLCGEVEAGVKPVALRVHPLLFSG